MDTADPRPVDRTHAFGVDYRLSVMDRFGMWLSKRQIERQVRGLRGKRIADIGCGHNALFVRSVLDVVEHATLVDVTLAEDLKAHPKLTSWEGMLPGVLEGIPSGSFDVVVCNNTLEHLWDPEAVVTRIRTLLRPGGTCFLNVPSWRGKRVLEAAAFRFGLTVREEIDDHKAYYDRRELWKLVVRAGFKPSHVTCRAHKFGLNTYAVCSVD
jgi:2-polyprenyl-3-methyl-5-hydroxy-6-metoxy-1,4-benzoquinol methylase